MFLLVAAAGWRDDLHCQAPRSKSRQLDLEVIDFYITEKPHLIVTGSAFRANSFTIIYHLLGRSALRSPELSIDKAIYWREISIAIRLDEMGNPP